MLKIDITPEAQEFIRQFGDAITLEMEVCGTCGRRRGEPAVYVGAPESPEIYVRTEVDGITVYVRKRAIVSRNGLRLSLVEDEDEKGILVEGLLG
ncbi:MAG: CC/Se motif family (seleno)protein [Moorellales bacterium]